MDEKDLKILDLLIQDASLSTYRISKKTGIPQTTVLNRMRNLKAEGVIKRTTLDLDFKKLGKAVKALIFAKVNNRDEQAHGTLGRIEAKLSALPAVLNVKRLMGKWDLLVELVTQDVEELNTFLMTRVRSIKEVEETETIVVLGEWQERHLPVRNYGNV